MKALEVKTKTDNNGHLKVDIPLNLKNKDVRLLILMNENNDIVEDEKLWLYSVKNNPSFDFLNDPEEDVYSLNDGKPISDDEK
ncbi:MAG: hypothetical protein ACOCWD_06310 [Tangfeifania sp.]